MWAELGQRENEEMSEAQGKGGRPVWMEKHLLRVRESKGWQGAPEMQKIFIWKANKARVVSVGGKGCSWG